MSYFFKKKTIIITGVVKALNANSVIKFPIKTSYLFDLVNIISLRKGTKAEFKDEDIANLML